jgi:hypothetical protein
MDQGKYVFAVQIFFRTAKDSARRGIGMKITALAIEHHHAEGSGGERVPQCVLNARNSLRS